MHDALRADLVVRNVAGLDTPPRSAETDTKALTVEQARTLLAAIRGDRLEALYVLALMTSLRQGELLALTWQYVELKGRYIQVHSSHRRMKGRFVVTRPKSSRRRRVALTQIAARASGASRALQEHRARRDPLWQDNDLVFPDELGERMSGIRLYQSYFLPLLKRAGLPRIRFHDLRHTAATLALRDRVDLNESLICSDTLPSPSPQISTATSAST